LWLLPTPNDHDVYTLNLSYIRITFFCFILKCFVKHRCRRKTNNPIVWQTG
jgi:hypothetical protein